MTDTHQVLVHGLIEHILPGNSMEDEVLEWTENLTKNDRNFIQVIKEGADRYTAANRKEALDAEVEPFSKLWVDEQHISRVEKFIKKRSK